MLAFTDNRQDASLQSGHFNDFAQVGLLRGALYAAAGAAGPAGLSHEVLAGAVVRALNLPRTEWAREPETKSGHGKGRLCPGRAGMACSLNVGRR